METRIDLAKYFDKLGFKEGAEIGVADGYFSQVLCENIPGLILHCIDPWSVYKENRRGGKQLQHDDNYTSTLVRLSGYDAELIMSKSEDAVFNFEDNSLDFVYIDGNHDFDYVMQDIIIWSRKVKPGGIISGHDYYHFRNSGVIEAVDCYTKYHNKQLNIIKECNLPRRDDRHPNWWFVK